jgi:hypothetical protein
MPNLEQVTCRERTVTPINSAISSRLFVLLNEILDLLDSLRRKLYRSSIRWQLRGKLFGLRHFYLPLERLLRLFGDRSFLDGVARPSDGLKFKFMNSSAQVKSWQECV